MQHDTGSQSGCDVTTKVEVLLAEYGRMYELASFRLNALDRRVPLEAGALVAFLASVSVLPEPTRIGLLLGVPLAVVWLVRSTVNHASSFEDALTRIAEIELRVNELVEEDVLRFQSRHPSRGKSTGGRTSRVSVRAVLTACHALLVGCCFAVMTAGPIQPSLLGLYLCYLTAVGVWTTWTAVRLRVYRYEPQVLGGHSSL